MIELKELSLRKRAEFYAILDDLCRICTTCGHQKRNHGITGCLVMVAGDFPNGTYCHCKVFKSKRKEKKS